MGLQWFLHLRLDVDRRRLRQLGVGHPGRQDVDRPGLLGVGYAGRRVLGVDRPGRRVVDVDRPGRPVRLDVGRAGHRVVDVGHPGRLRRAFPAGTRTGCSLDVDHLGVERPDVVHGCRPGSGHGVRRSQSNACPAGRRTGCCLGVVPLASGLACCLALVQHLATEHLGLPLELALQGPLEQPVPERRRLA